MRAFTTSLSIYFNRGTAGNSALVLIPDYFASSFALQGRRGRGKDDEEDDEEDTLTRRMGSLSVNDADDDQLPAPPVAGGKAPKKGRGRAGGANAAAASVDKGEKEDDDAVEGDGPAVEAEGEAEESIAAKSKKDDKKGRKKVRGGDGRHAVLDCVNSCTCTRIPLYARVELWEEDLARGYSSFHPRVRDESKSFSSRTRVRGMTRAYRALQMTAGNSLKVAWVGRVSERK